MDLARRQLEVNVVGQMRLAQLVLPAMRANGAGRIINVSSMGGRFAMAFGGWYHASKYALEALNDALRQEVSPFGIKVIAIEPGAIRTEWSQVAGRNAALTSGQGIYSDRASRMTNVLNRPWMQRLQTNSDRVAKTIIRAIQTEHPRARYVVGMGARPVLFLRRVLPDRVMDKALALISG